ncbi:MAG: AHH domain-containing protein [Actinomycetota bacterium]
MNTTAVPATPSGRLRRPLRLLVVVALLLGSLTFGSASPAAAADTPKCMLGVEPGQSREIRGGTKLEVTWRYFVACTDVHGTMGNKTVNLSMWLHSTDGNRPSSSKRRVACTTSSCIPTYGVANGNYMKTGFDVKVTMAKNQCRQRTRYVSGQVNSRTLGPHLVASTTLQRADSGGQNVFTYVGTAVRTNRVCYDLERASSLLGRNMIKAGQKKPGDGYDAHHIVAWRDGRAAAARAILDRNGFDINDAANGAWLPAPYHHHLHSGDYYTEVNRRLTAADGSKRRVRTVLNQLRRELQAGKQF